MMKVDMHIYRIIYQTFILNYVGCNEVHVGLNFLTFFKHSCTYTCRLQYSGPNNHAGPSAIYPRPSLKEP